MVNLVIYGAWCLDCKTSTCLLCHCVTFAVKSCSVKLIEIRNISEIVHSALVVFIQFCNNIVNGKVCMNDLAKCHRNVEALQNLCNAVNSEQAPLCQSFNHVKSGMDLCSKKFEYVEKYYKMVEVVVKHCNKISKGTQAFTYT